MPEYYGVQRSEEYLAHYGVKGMKWGVRKAIESHNERRLGRQYKKAAKKLAKLEARADVNIQAKKAAKYNKVAKISAGVGSAGVAVGTAGLASKNLINSALSRNKGFRDRTAADYDERIKKATDKVNGLKADDWAGWKRGDYKKLGISKEESAKRIQNYHDNIIDKYGEHKRLAEEKAERMKTYDAEESRLNNLNKTRSVASQVGLGVGLAGLGTAAVAKAKAHAAKKRTTSEGHAKAVAERDAWKKEMQTAFKGTKYANLPPRQSKKKRG